MTLMETIDRYQVKAACGSGGMAKVYHAYDPELDIDVAVKLIRSTVNDHPQIRERFQQECRLLANLRHPAIVPILNVGDYLGRPYFVMPYMSGGALRERLMQDPLPLTEISPIVERLAGALDAAHAQNIIHRDLKPHNILFNAAGDAFLADFGIARLINSEDSLHTMTMIGTPEYMSPEQVLEGTLSRQTDIYQFGVVLFQMLTGSRPFEGAAHHVMTQHLHADVPAVSTLNSRLSTQLDAVIFKAMAKDPNARYHSAAALATDFKAALAGASGAAVRHHPAPKKRRSRKPQRLVLAVLALGVLGSALAFTPVVPRGVRDAFAEIPRLLDFGNNGNGRNRTEVEPVEDDSVLAETDADPAITLQTEIAVAPTLTVATEVTPLTENADSAISLLIEEERIAAASDTETLSLEELLANRGTLTLTDLDPAPLIEPTLVPTVIVPTAAPTAILPTAVQPTAVQPTAIAPTATAVPQPTIETVQVQETTNDAQQTVVQATQQDPPNNNGGRPPRNGGGGNGDGRGNRNGDGNGGGGGGRRNGN